jgi:hypothetical protein
MILATRLPIIQTGDGWISVIDSRRRTIWIVDADSYGKRFIVRADEIPTAFVEPAACTPRPYMKIR